MTFGKLFLRCLAASAGLQVVVCVILFIVRNDGPVVRMIAAATRSPGTFVAYRLWINAGTGVAPAVLVGVVVNILLYALLFACIATAWRKIKHVS